MNLLLWILQGLAALLYASSGFMKTFLFEKVSKDVKSFGALPPGVWKVLGISELLGAVGLILPGALPWHPALVGIAAAVLALESLIFVGVHVKYREPGTIVVCVVLGLVMAFIAYGRLKLAPGL